MALEVVLVEDPVVWVLDASVVLELVLKMLDEVIIDGVKELKMVLLELG